MIGTTLGPYHVVAKLGKGGMGEVYKARDTRLDRMVAIKVLPGDAYADRQARERFEREARAISALTDPHICTLYDVGHQDGVDFLVMELVDGETLAARLMRGPVPLAQALRCGVELAAALDRAHRAGIVHRDVKPGNVMVTRGGVKLLDFGLARPTPASAAASSAETPSTAVSSDQRSQRRRRGDLGPHGRTSRVSIQPDERLRSLAERHRWLGAGAAAPAQFIEHADVLVARWTPRPLQPDCGFHGVGRRAVLLRHR